MFGMGFFEILIILVVAIIFLGPDKLPQAIVDVVKFFKAVKKTIAEAKDTIDKELQIDELRKEALDYKQSFQSSVDDITKDIQLKEINEMFDEYKELPKSIAKDIQIQPTALLDQPKTQSQDEPAKPKEPKPSKRPKKQEPKDSKKAETKSVSSKASKTKTTKTKISKKTSE